MVDLYLIRNSLRRNFFQDLLHPPPLRFHKSHDTFGSANVLLTQQSSIHLIYFSRLPKCLYKKFLLQTIYVLKYVKND